MLELLSLEFLEVVVLDFCLCRIDELLSGLIFLIVVVCVVCGDEGGVGYSGGFFMCVC